MFEKKKTWYITFYADQEFYNNLVESQAVIDEQRKGSGNPLASQYAKYGRHRLCDAEVEVLSDGR